MPNDIFMNLARIDCRDLKAKFLQLCQNLKDQILEFMFNLVKKLNYNIGKEFSHIFKVLSQRAENEEKLVEQEQFCERMQKVNFKELQDSYNSMLGVIYILYDFNFKINIEFLQQIQVTSVQLKQFESKI